MLTDFEYLCFAHEKKKLSDLARAYIQLVRTSEPSRMVGKHARSNVVSFLPSQKMQRTISTESRGPEKAFVVLSEFDDRVLEYWDQPEPINIERSDKNGRRRKASYTPDFLVLTENGVELIEVKSFDDVKSRTERYPSDWTLGDDGSARFLPGENAAKKLGLGFRVWVYQPSLRFFVENIELLLRSRSAQDLSEGLHERLEKALKRQFAWTLDELASYLDLEDMTGLIQSIDKGLLFSDLRTQLLSQPSGCVVASSIVLAQQAIELIDQRRITPGEFKRQPRSTLPSKREALEALDRLERLKNGEKSRQARRWKNLLKQGKSEGLNEFQSLLPKVHRRGNRRRKINKVVEDTLYLYLTEKHGFARGMSKYWSYIRYKEFAKESHPHFEPVNPQTWRRRLARLPEEFIAFQRGGKRAGNAAADASDTHYRQLRALLPWQLVSIDHYLADVYVAYFTSSEEVLVERPWVTAMVDQATGSLLAFTVSFLSPSKRSVAKIFRECVRLYGQLPLEVMVDRGSDFRSVYMASLLAHYEVGLSMRPASHSRFGGEVERFFGEFKQQWLSQRAGNLADYKEARSVDGKLSPRQQAILRPEDFIRELAAYRQWRENAMKGTKTESAGYKLSALARQYPFIGKPVQYDSEFIMMTAIDTKDYAVDQKRGISANGRWYYATELRKLRGRKKEVEVRLDPENPSVIYALVEGTWIPCFSSEASSFKALDGPTQLAQGLTQLEVSARRRKNKEEQDIALVKIVREMDLIAAKSRECPVAFTEATDQEPETGEDVAENWLGTLEIESLPPLQGSDWEVQE